VQRRPAPLVDQAHLRTDALGVARVRLAQIDRQVGTAATTTAWVPAASTCTATI